MPCPQTLKILTEILRETASDIEALGAALCTDEMLMLRHCTALQSIDVIAQRQNGIAQFLEEYCRHEAVESLSLEALQERLRLPNPAAAAMRKAS
ncbi:hypothetical protein GRI58_02225 [Porphyrobacter algicida]|uniref:Uncharacterized protein n=1 Tax=Qipengyuania algicida TaxID=1836209 RepID=A0A845ADS4_9SPHN|nr:hypothetical protein [Qipengyuania algicida]MXP27637.1 hypothetical protein [Qipengyuania algicida]